MPNIVIREVLQADAPELSKLMMQLGYPISVEQMMERINLYCLQPCRKAWVAEINQVVVGSIAIDVIELFHREGRFARIVALIVDENYRQYGIGKALVQQLELYAQQIGCVQIEVTTGWHRAKSGAHDFYKKLGYSELKLYLAKEF